MPLYFLQSAIPSASGAPKTSTMFFVKKAPYAQSSLLLSVGTERRGKQIARIAYGTPRRLKKVTHIKNITSFGKSRRC